MVDVIESTHMASQQLTEEVIYLCNGNPLPRDIEQICHWLLNESFATSCKRISEIKTIKGLSLLDIVREVTIYTLCLACNDKLQLGSLIAAFTRARASLAAAAK